MNMEVLLLYVREDGLFARLILNEETVTVQNEAVRAEISEETLQERFRELLSRFAAEHTLRGRRVTVVYALSGKVGVLQTCVREMLRGLVFADSVSLLHRDELFYRAARVLSTEHPRQVLYCDSRETRLFTSHGEYFLRETGVSVGNGFLDWILGFAEGEGDSPEYFLRQSDRLAEIFRVYKCFSKPDSEEASNRVGIFPDRSAHPILATRPKLSDGIELVEGGALVLRKRQKETPAVAGSAEQPIYYAMLSPADRARVDRRYPALYRSVRDKWGNYKQISIGDMAAAFAALFGCIEEAPLSDLVAVGQYARYPLTVDFLSALPQKPTVTFASESTLLLDGMEEAVSDRIRSSRLTLRDIDGEEIVLWDSDAESDGPSREKRVCFAATLKKSISLEEWKRKEPKMPYSITLEEPRREANGSYVKRMTVRSGDLKDFCYKRQRDGSYRLRLADANADGSTFRTVLLGIVATPVGVCCRILGETDER